MMVDASDNRMLEIDVAIIPVLIPFLNYVTTAIVLSIHQCLINIWRILGFTVLIYLDFRTVVAIIRFGLLNS